MKTYIQIILGIILFASCDPVKRVASDPRKLAQIAPEIIRAGYCIPDTIEVKKTDTITEIDTLEIPVMIPDTSAHEPGDTIRMIEVKRKVIHSVKYVTNTITKTIVDTARIKQLTNDLIIARDSIRIQDQQIREYKKGKSRDIQLIGALAMTGVISFLALVAIIRYTTKK